MKIRLYKCRRDEPWLKFGWTVEGLAILEAAWFPTFDRARAFVWDLLKARAA